MSGSWEGYEEDESGNPVSNRRWRLSIEGVSAGELRGTVTFGEGDPVAPATDPEGPFPEDDPPVSYRASLRSGQTYSLLLGTARDELVRFQISATEIMRSWCEIQPVYDLGDGTYFCFPSFNNVWHHADGCRADYYDGTHEFTPAQCDQCWMCACDAWSCTADSRWERELFDLALDATGNVLTGQVWNRGDAKRAVRLQRVAAE